MSEVPQLPLALRPETDYRFETFVGPVEIPGRLQALASRAPGHVLVAGAPGSGKTHLALATARAAATCGLAVQYLGMDSLGERRAAALGALQHLDLVVLDDLDAGLGEPQVELALFNFHNRMQAHGARVLYTACEGPAALPVQLPDLRSRLAQCTQLVLPRPDDSLRREVLQRRAKARGWLLDDAAVEYILRRSGRDLPSLTGLLDQLDRASLAQQRRVTVPFIRSVLGLGQA